MQDQSKKIKKFILKQVIRHPTDIILVTTKQFNVTRTTAHRHLNKLIRDKLIIKSGTTKNVKYYLASTFNRTIHYNITPDLSEDEALKTGFLNIVEALSKNNQDVFTYGFTEIFNNAIDHSRGKKIVVSTQYNKNRLILSIADDGIGIFKNIHDVFKLDDVRESILQLTKGKITTDPIRHTGEGLFFTMRMFEIVEIKANRLRYLRNNRINDWGIMEDKIKKGSMVIMTLNLINNPNLIEVFNKYQHPETLSFNRTEIIVAMAKFGEETFISRSQAKRILLGLEKFEQITLDFSGVRLIGQGFADEIFRVFQNKYPNIKIDYIHANDDVEFMIKRSIK